MRARRLAALPLAALLLLQPLAPRRAAADELSSESRVGVALMVACGLALKATLSAPVPWAGIAVASCIMGLVDAALSPDEYGQGDTPSAP